MSKTSTIAPIGELETLLAHPRVIALGETGLDYFKKLLAAGCATDAFSQTD